MSYHLHEELYRGPTLMERLATVSIAICGAGALGANLAESLARMGARRLTIIDKDRISDHNLSTQPYGRAEVGAQKAKILAHSLYRCLGLTVQAEAVEMTPHNVGKLLRGAELVLDCFDNTASRQLVKDHCVSQQRACLHAGMASDYAEVLWNEGYRVPLALEPDRCDYPLARTLVQLTVAVAAEIVLQYLDTGERVAKTITLRDLCVLTG